MFGFGKSDKVRDPICKMSVDKNKAQFSYEYKGEKYYFCSENCKNRFNTNPKDFAKQDTSSPCC